MIFQGKEIINRLNLDLAPKGEISRFWMDIVANGIGQDILIPVMVARGNEDGPVLGLTAVVHGNELNGLSVIQRLFNEVRVKKLRGTIVGVPVLNVPSILNQERHFIDGVDLNRIFPGKAEGDMSEVYSYRIVDRIVSQFGYLIDLHTASFGRVNSYYIRADMENAVTARMAHLQHAQIVLNAAGEVGTLRSAAMDLGIHAITVEVGDPDKFQKGMIRSGLSGIYNVMADLGMTEDDIEEPDEEAMLCRNSYWLYADRGGIMEVFPHVADMVVKGKKIAVVRNVFGEIIMEYKCPEDGIVIGKHVHPVNQTGGRILHLGIR